MRGSEAGLIAGKPPRPIHIAASIAARVGDDGNGNVRQNGMVKRIQPCCRNRSDFPLDCGSPFNRWRCIATAMRMLLV